MHSERKSTESVTVETLGEQLRTAIPLARVNSVSIYDRSGNVLWLSEGALGPDEHSLVIEALEAASQRKDESWEELLEDGRAAILMPVRSPQGEPVGLVLVLTEIKYDSDTVKTRVLSTGSFELLKELAPLMPAVGQHSNGKELTWANLSLVEDPIEIPEDRPKGLQNSRGPQPPPALEAPKPKAPALDDDSANLTGLFARPRIPAAVNGHGGEVSLEVLPFVRLRAGGRMRRFEVLPRGTPQQQRSPAQLDLSAVEQLLAWLDKNRAAWAQEPTSFTLSVSLATLENADFLRQVGQSLVKHKVSPEALGFEIAEPLCVQHRLRAERFIEECEQLGCFIIIDNFSFDSAVVPLLRHKAISMVKIHPKLTAAVWREKLSQAIVMAIVNAAKVLGIHCAVKKLESPGALRWLKEVGCDMVQAEAGTQAKPIDSLKAPPARTISKTAVS